MAYKHKLPEMRYHIIPRNKDKLHCSTYGSDAIYFMEEEHQNKHKLHTHTQPRTLKFPRTTN